MLIIDVLKFIVGNTFPMVVFGSFGGFWAVYGATLTPFYSAFANYAPYDMADPAMVPTAGTGLNAPEFNNSFAFFLVWMGVLCLVYLICALRTNVFFVMIFFTLVPAFALLAAAFMYLGLENTTRAQTLIIAGGAFAFVTCICGWWIFTAILLAALDFPFQLPGMFQNTLTSNPRPLANLLSRSLRSLDRHQGWQRQGLNDTPERVSCRRERWQNLEICEAWTDSIRMAVYDCVGAGLL